MKPGHDTLLIDIETFPLLVYTWQIYEANAIRVVEPTCICCVSVKWLDGKQETKALPDFKGYKPGSRNDLPLMKWLWPFLDEASIVVAHNGRAFDVKKIAARFAVHGIQPPSPFRQVDTLKEARAIAAFDSNKLNDLGTYLDLGEKLKTGGADLWFDCLAGKKDAWAHMKKYNAHDVVLLEKLYLKLRPWMKSHPNVAIGYGPFLCSKCGSSRLHYKGPGRSGAGIYDRYRCRDCGTNVRGTKNLLDKDNRPFVSIS
jgi:hypothetical protein